MNEEYIKKIETTKEMLNLLPQNNKKNKTKFKEIVLENLNEFKNDEVILLEEIKKRYNVYMSTTLNEEIPYLESELSNLKDSLILSNKYASSYQMSSLDRVLYNLSHFYKEDLESVNSYIKEAILIFKSAGIILSIEDFNYSYYSGNYMKRFLSNEVNDDIASLIVSQLLFLESQDPTKDIHLYINSPGGSVSAGFAIYDTMNYVKCDVSTICMGMAASMGAFLLAGGAKGKRLALPNAEIMIHQPSGGAKGQETEIRIVAEQILKTRDQLNRILAENTGKPLDVIAADTERDNYMTAQEAKEYGLIDEIVTNRK